MTALLRGAMPRVLLPALCGVVLGVVLQVTVPRVRLYAAVAPGFLAGLAGLLGAGLVATAVWYRGRAAAAAGVAVRQAVADAAQERLRFLLRLDHELKNPLTAIRAGIANIEASPGTAEVGAMLASVSAQADRIAGVAGDLRKLADLETHQIEIAPVDLPGLLHEVTDAVREIPVAAQRDIRVTVPQAPWPLPAIEGDRDLLFIALQNLVANAVKFSSAGDKVEIRASEEDDGLLLEVADTGPGIPADEIGEVWQELARGRQARSVPGTGIGLALVRVIVSRHDGKVAIRSRVGQGTVVSVRLPLSRSRSSDAGTATDVAGPRHRRDAAGKAAR